MSAELIAAAQVVFLLYFLGLNFVYVMLNVLAFPGILRYLQARSLDRLPYRHAGFEPGISIIAPAFNEEATIGHGLLLLRCRGRSARGRWIARSARTVSPCWHRRATRERPQRRWYAAPPIPARPPGGFRSPHGSCDHCRETRCP